MNRAGEQRGGVKWRVMRVPEPPFSVSESSSEMVNDLLADDKHLYCLAMGSVYDLDTTVT